MLPKPGKDVPFQNSPNIFRRNQRRTISIRSSAIKQLSVLTLIYAILLMAIPVQALAANGKQTINSVAAPKTQTAAAQTVPDAQIAASKSQISSPDNSIAASGDGQTATVLENGDVLIVGGDPSGATQIYSSAASAFGATGTLNVPRSHQSAVRLNDGRVLISGGTSGGKTLASNEIFDSATGRFELAGEMTQPRLDHTATILADGRVLIAGGGTAEIFDAANNSSAQTGLKMNEARQHHSAVALSDGRVLIVGGRDEKDQPLNSAEVFDPSTNKFSALGAMTNARANAVLRALPDGKIQIIGGADTPSMEIFDAKTGAFGASVKIPANGNDFPELFNEIMGSPTRFAVTGKTTVELPQMKKALSFENSNGLTGEQIFDISTAAITTESLGYAPGDQIVVSGRGFQPGENIQLVFYQPENPNAANAPRLTAQADESGAFRFDGFSSTETGTFLIAAKGEISGEKGQTSVASLSPGSLVNYPTAGLSGASSSVPVNLTNSDPDATYSDIVRGTGINAVSASGAFNANQWSTAAALDTANNDYFEFSVDPCDTFSANQVAIGLRRSANGPVSAVLRSSVDNFASNIGSVITVTETATRTVINLSAIAGLQNTANTVKFRIYGYGAASGGGTMQIMPAGTSPNQTVGIEVDGSANSNPPTITQQPTNQTIIFGSDASFTSTASSGSQQWQVSTNNGASWSDISGETGNTLTLTSPGIAQSGFRYRSKFSGDCGMAFSNAATLTVNQASATVTLSDLSQTYNGTPRSATATTNPNGLSVDFSYVGTGLTTYLASATPPTDAGTYKVTATVNDSNYTGSDTKSFTIAPRILIVTASASNKTYDGNTNASATITGDDRISGDEVTVTFTSASFDNKNAGTGKTVTLSGVEITGGADAGNYVLSTSPVTAMADITALEITVTVTVKNKEYDRTTDATIQTRTPNGVLAADADHVSVTGGTATFDNKNVGDGKSVSITGLTLTGTLTGDQSGNYSITGTASTMANITPKPLTAAATAADKVYDGTTATTAMLSSADVITDDVVTFAYESATFDTATAGTGKTVTVSGISISGADASNYALQSTSATDSADITRAPSTTTITSTNPGTLVYRGTYQVTAITTGDGALTISASPEEVCTIDSSNLVTMVSSTGTCTVTATTAQGTNYKSSSDSQMFSADKATATLSFVTATLSQSYSGSPRPVEVMTNPSELTGVSITYSSSSYTASTTAPTNAGSYTVVASLTNDNYRATDITGTLVISSIGQTITFDQTLQGTYGDPDFSLSASSNSGLSVNFSASSETPACTVVSSSSSPSGFSLHIVSAGACTITASQHDANGNYTDASKTRTFTIEKKQLVVTADNKTITFGDDDPTFTFSYSDDFVFGEDSTVIDTPPTCSVPVAHTNAGQYDIVCSGSSDNNYRFSFGATNPGRLTVKRATQTIVFTNPGAHTYGDADFALQATGGGSGNDITFESNTPSVCTVVSGSMLHIVKAGSCSVTASQEGSDNYDADSDTQMFTIGKATPIISVTDKTFEYDGEAHPATGSVTGVGNPAENLGSPTFTYTPGDSNAPVSVGDYTVTASYAETDNYTSASKTATIKITAAPATVMITFASPNSGSLYVYRGTAFTATARVTGAGGLDKDITSSIQYSGTSVVDGSCVNAGTCIATATFSDENHSEDTKSETITIGKATPTVSITGNICTYDPNAACAASGSVSGVTVNGTPENLTPLTFEYSQGGNPLSGAPVNAGTYSVVGKFAGNGNYTSAMSASPATITINKADQTITFGTLPNKFYGDADFDLYELTGTDLPPSASSGLPLTFTASSSPLSGLCTVTGSVVHIAGEGSCTITATQGGNSNYNPASDVSQTFTITTSTTNVIVSITDPVTHRSRTTLPESGPVTIDVPITVGDVTNHGFTSFDFAVRYDASQLTPAASTSSSPNLPVVVSEGDVAFSSALTSNVFPVQMNDPSYRKLSVSGQQNYPMSGAGRLLSLRFTANNIGCSPISFVKPNEDDVSAFFFNTGTVPSTIVTGTVCIAEDTTTTVTFENEPYVYRGTPFIATAKVVGKKSGETLATLSGDDIVYTGNCTNVTMTDGCTASATFAGDDTHITSSGTASITITKRPITVLATADNKSYDGTTAATAHLTLSPAVSDGSATYTSATFDTADAGTGKTVTVSGISLVGVDLSNNEQINMTAKALADITKAIQTINFAALSAKRIDSGDFDVSATVTAPTSGGSSNPITFSASPSSVCTISGSTVHLVNYGECTITASKLSDSNYKDATPVSRSFNVVPYTNNLSVSLPPSPASSYHGTPFAVPVSISETGLNGINTITFDLSYNSEIWNPATTFVTGADFGGTVTRTVSNGVVHVTISSVSPSSYLTGAGSVVLNFVSSNTGSSQFSLSNFFYSSNTPSPGHTGGADVSNSPLTVNVTNGDISGTVLSFYNGIAIPGVTLTATSPGSSDLKINTLSNGTYDLFGFGDGGYTVTPSKPSETADSAVTNTSILSRDVTYIQRYRVGLPPNPADPNSFWTDKMQAAADVDQNGVIQSFDASLIQQFRAGIPNAVNKTGLWKFAVSPTPAPTDPPTPVPSSRTYNNVFTPKTAQDYTALLLGDVDGSLMYPSSLAALSSQSKSQPVEFAARDNAGVPNVVAATNVNVALPTNNQYTGPVSFNAPISVGDVTGQGITSYDIQVFYDPAVIQPLANPVDTSGTLSSNMSVVANGSTPGKITISGSGINPISGSGALLKLVFKAVGNAGSFSDLRFNQFIFNNGVPGATLANGKITILGPTAAGVSVSGRLLTSLGRGLTNASVILTDSRGIARTARSSAFGNFRFDDVAAGETYIVSVNSKGYKFTPQIVNITGELSGLNLTANP